MRCDNLHSTGLRHHGDRTDRKQDGRHSQSAEEYEVDEIAAHPPGVSKLGALHTICLLAVPPGQSLVVCEHLIPSDPPLSGNTAGNVCLLAER